MEIAIRMGLQAIQRAGSVLLRHYDRLQAGQQSPAEHVQQSMTAVALKECAFALEKNSQHTPICLSGEEDPNRHRQWVLNPFDGAALFSRQIPEFCLNLQLKIKQKTQHAILYEPIQRQAFHASKGQGAYGNEHRLRVSQPQQRPLLIGVAQHADSTSIDANLALLKKISGAGHDYYHHHCLDLLTAYLCAGKIDALISHQSTAEQRHTATLLIRESGGLMANWEGHPHQQSSDWIAAHPKVLQLITSLTHSA